LLNSSVDLATGAPPLSQHVNKLESKGTVLFVYSGTNGFSKENISLTITLLLILFLDVILYCLFCMCFHLFAICIFFVCSCAAFVIGHMAVVPAHKKHVSRAYT
jgi:hypothetical protein